MSNTEMFFTLLGCANAVTIDDGAMLTEWETEDATGCPENQVVRFSWTDGCSEYSDILTEEGIAKGMFDGNGKFVAENVEGEKTVIRFFEVNRLFSPFSGRAAARLFMRELLDSVETLAGIAEEHGARTLADLMYLHSTILNGGFIDHYPGESKVLEIAQGLPSGEQWAKFIKVEYLDQAAFKTTLFKLLNSDAAMIVDGYEIETVQDCGVDANGAQALRCECDEDHEWFFADQEVVVSEGKCQAMTASGDWDFDCKPYKVTLEFRVARPITERDL